MCQYLLNIFLYRYKYYRNRNILDKVDTFYYGILTFNVYKLCILTHFKISLKSRPGPYVSLYFIFMYIPLGLFVKIEKKSETFSCEK